MKKSLACTVLAGLLAGCVMTGAEAGETIVIDDEGHVNVATYGGGGYIGVYGGSETLSLGSAVSNIKTAGDGPMTPRTWGSAVYGILVDKSNRLVTGSSIQEININTDSSSYGVHVSEGNIKLYDVGSIIAKGYRASGIEMNSDSSIENIITFSDSDSDGKGDGLIIVDATGNGATGIDLGDGKHYIGTYLDGEGNRVNGKELRGVEVLGAGDVEGIYVWSRTGCESVMAFSGKESHISVTSSDRSATGIEMYMNMGNEITGLGCIEATSVGGDAYGINITHNSENLKLDFMASDFKDTVRAIGEGGKSYGIKVAGQGSFSEHYGLIIEQRVEGHVTVTGIRSIVAGDVTKSLGDSYGIYTNAHDSTFAFTGDGSIDVSSKSGSVYGIYSKSKMATVSGLKKISVYNDGENARGKEGVGVYSSGDSSLNELHSIDVFVHGKSDGVRADGETGETVLVFDGAGSSISSTSVGNYANGICAIGLEGSFSVYDLGKITVEGEEGGCGLSILSTTDEDNIVTFASGQGNGLVSVRGLWPGFATTVTGIDLYSGKHYVGTYLDGEGNRLNGKELQGVEVSGEYDADVTGICLGNSSESVIAFGGKESYIISTSSGGSATGIHTQGFMSDVTCDITGLGYMEVTSNGGDVYGIDIVGSSDNLKLDFTSSDVKDTIKVVVDGSGTSYGIKTSGKSVVTGIRSIVVEHVTRSLGDSYGIYVDEGDNTFTFTGDGSIDVSSKSGAVYGIYNVGGLTDVTSLIGLKSISVHNDGQHDCYAIYNGAEGTLNILNDDQAQLVSINGDVYSGQDAIIQLKNVVITGNFVGGGPLNTSYNIRFFEKVIVNGDMNISEGITISDGGDFVFGKTDNTNSIFLKSLSSFDANTKVKIYGNGILTSNTGNVYTEGTTVFAGDCTIGHSNGSGTVIAESGLLYAQGNIENKFIVKNGASLVTTARSIGSDISIEEGANLYIVDRQVGDDILNNNIKGVGTTYLQQGSALTNYLTNYYHENGIDYDPPKPTVIKVNTNQTIEGTLNGSDGTIKLAGGTAYTLTVGKLAGITNLDVAVNFSGGSAVNGMMSIGAAESGAVLNVSNVNVTADIPDGTNNGVVTYATGAGVAGVTHKVNGQVGGSITASANKLYTFTQDMLNPGKLNWSVQTTSNPITFKEFIEGTYEGKPSTLSLTENMVDGPNGGTADSGLASQTNSVLNINANNHNLGTNGNNFTVNVAGGKTINLNGGATGGTVYTNWDVANSGTFNMSGVNNMEGTISGSGSAKNEGTLNIAANNLQIALNNNGGVVNLSGGTLANTITGGQLNIVENVSAAADNVKGDVNSVASGKILNLTAGSLSKNVGGEGSVEIGGTVAVNSVVQTGVTVKNGGILTADLQNLQSTVTNNGQFNMAGNLTKNIAGNGVTVLQNNIQPDNVTITGTLNGNGKTIDMQEQGGTAAYKTLTVGKLAGTTLLKIDADLQDGNNDKLVVNGDSTGAVMDVVGVNVTKDVVMDSSTYTKNGSFTYVEGSGVNSITYKLNGSEAADASLLGTTATNNFVYTFTKGDAGKLNYKADVAGITFIKFIQGELEGVPDTLSLTENMADGPNGGTADSGLASQTNDKLYVNLNGHTLGTEGNKFTVKVANGKEVYLNGGTGHTSRVYTGWTLGDVGTGYASMNTSGGLTISGDIGGVGMLNNDGTVTIGGNVNGSLLLTNSGSLVLDGRKINVGQITNTGELIINSNKTPGTYYINGDVYHTGATRTEINLVGTNNNEGRAALAGRVYGSDNNFKMTLDRAEWLMDNIVERSAPADFGNIHNVSLAHDANVSFNLNTGYHLDTNQRYASSIAWRDVYGTATFHNLKNDGTGRINLAVDLANNTGDQIILQGETPAKLGVALVNKDNNDDMEFVPDGEHKVTYAKAPLSSDLEIDTSLVPVYGKQSMIYTPIVEKTTTDMREWNFIGWSQRPRGDDKSTAKDELDVPNLMPEMEEKRLEEIHRYAVHKDLSELGAWVRGETGKMSADGVDFDVKVISGGYDWANKTSKGNFFMGLGVSHGTSNADMGFVGDSKNTSFSVYGSWYGRKNYDYIDFVAKYGKIDHQYNGINFDDVPCSGEYDKKMYSLFAKYGRRLPLKNGYYVEPFGSVTYGHIGDADFYDNGQGAHMHVNSILSKILSVGAMFGRSVKGTELYCKLAYSYDFDGEIKGSVSDLNYSEKTDMGGSSYKFAVGASRNLGKQNSLHLDLEKDFGGKMKRPWNLALTFKHTW